MQKAAVRRSLIGVSLVLLGCAFSASCDTAKRVKSKVVAINLLLDIGDPFDLAPRRTELAVNLMAISGPVDEPETTPLTGADVTLEIEDVAGVIQVAEAGAGTYVASSGTGGGATLVYQSGASYAVTIDVPDGSFDGEYDLRVTAPPRTNATGLPDTANGATITAGQSLTVTLTGSYDRGIYIVVDSAGNVTEDSRPETVEEAIDFAFGDFEGQLVIPGTAFPSAGTAYGVVIVGLESAPQSAISSNLNILSRFYAGSAKTAIVVTAP